MSLPVPNLDDRKFVQLVEEAVRRIPRHARDWTDHNVHDPGITLLELFAWLAEMQIYYLNQVPARHEMKFLRLLGFSPRPATSAKANVTFLPKNALFSITIPRRTQVAALKPGTSERIVFETDVDLQVLPLRLEQVITSDRTGLRDNLVANNQVGNFYYTFGERAEEGSALYLGLDFQTSPPAEFFMASPPEALQLTLMVSLYEDDLPAPGVYGDESIQKGNDLSAENDRNDEKLRFFPSAEVAWEYWNGERWTQKWEDGMPLLQKDHTWAFSRSGYIVFSWPPDFARRKIPPLGDDHYWLRCRVIERGYEISPRIESVRLNTAPVTQGATVENEPLGSSNQLPSQAFQFPNSPILAGTQTIEVMESDGRWKSWQEVPDFDASGPDDEHYVIDLVAGEVRFSNGINGRIPPAGARNIRAAIYRYGGGTVGNVGAERIQIILDSHLCDIVAVTNKEPAEGGTEEEELPEAWRRARLDLRTPYQAVTSEDFEFLAKATPGLRVARAKALPLLEPPSYSERKGLVTVAVVPFSLSPKPWPSDGFLKTVCEHLDRHRLITTKVRVIRPDYVRVSVEATILLKPRVSAPGVQERVDAALDRFLDPLHGGVAGEGWEFGRSVYQSEIYQVIENVSGVDCVVRVSLAAQEGNFQIDGNNIKLTRPHGLVYPGEHQLEMIDPEQRCEVKRPCHELEK